MKTAPHISAEGGYTVVELTIAMLIAGLVGGVAYSTYTFAAQYVAQWRQAVELERTAHLVVRDVTQRVREARRLEQVADGLWTVDDRGGDATTYRHVGPTLLRDDVPMHDSTITVVRFQIRVAEGSADERAQQDRGGFEDRFDPVGGGEPLPQEFGASSQDGVSLRGERRDLRAPESAPRRPLVRIRFAAAAGRDTVRLETSVTYRQTASWALPESSAFP